MNNPWPDEHALRVLRTVKTEPGGPMVNTFSRNLVRQCKASGLIEPYGATYQLTKAGYAALEKAEGQPQADQFRLGGGYTVGS